MFFLCDPRDPHDLLRLIRRFPEKSQPQEFAHLLRTQNHY